MNVLEEAIELLSERGWHQGSAIGKDGSLCASMAIAEAFWCSKTVGTADEIGAAFGQLLGPCQHVSPGCYCRLIAFNDDPTTSEEDIRLLLKHAAALITPVAP